MSSLQWKSHVLKVSPKPSDGLLVWVGQSNCKPEKSVGQKTLDFTPKFDLFQVFGVCQEEKGFEVSSRESCFQDAGCMWLPCRDVCRSSFKTPAIYTQKTGGANSSSYHFISSKAWCQFRIFSLPKTVHWPFQFMKSKCSSPFSNHMLVRSPDFFLPSTFQLFLFI